MLFVIDLETSGLRPEAGAGVVELAAVCVKGGVITDRFSTYVWPGRECLQAEHRKVLAEVSGIDPLTLLDLGVPDVITARDRLTSWLLGNAGVSRPKAAHEWSELRLESEAAGKPPRTPLPLTTYNREFDLGFLERLPWQLSWYLRTQAPVEVVFAPCVMLAAVGAMGAAGVLERRRDGNWKWPRLPLAARHFGIEFSETHRALADAEAAARLAIALGVEGAHAS
jgi:DNA polymerase III epsilon subunit-like protein